MIRFKQSGDFSNAIRYLKNASELSKSTCFDKYGKEGVAALSAATPVDTGLTANSWYYTITYSNRGITISFNNSNISNGVPIALILQYGHATRTGGWVAGRDYINPAIQPIFDRMANEAWKEVTKL